jgi:hypothetical protein
VQCITALARKCLAEYFEVTKKRIAVILGICLHTVKKHWEHILHKLGVETRTAAASAALQFLSRTKGAVFPLNHVSPIN